MLTATQSHFHYLTAICFLSVGLLTLGGCSDDSETTTSLAGSGTGAASGGAGGSGGSGGTSAGGSSAGGSAAGGAGGSGGFNPSGGGGMQPCSNELTGTVRDFQVSHPDFEAFLAPEKGIVLPDLGADLKPVYASAGTTMTTTGKANFDQWYRDVPGVNQAFPHTIQLAENTPGIYTFEDLEFFPIDGLGWGDEGNIHNYHFTFEIHVEFEYVGGEVFTFKGDDDVFVFINGKLAIDLGGVHGAQEEVVDLDAQAAALGMTIGGTYGLDFFFAERHTSQSTFRIDTGIACFTEVEPPQ